ncbi:uncharacterized protein LOC109791997 [Cajanus cajan]|uniref:uncharacterized protein LOC109791997 n=1 Tax=Cajanus cajan TaxID=3821 RepID=UPI00098D8900|nr:uncharacterized protein LOC109791997 [Cajanus cajan]
MSKFEAMHKYFFFFVALVACHSLVAHGRKIKALNQHVAKPHLPSLKTSFESRNYNEGVSLGDSGEGNTNAFRPTTPGGSPGVGHRIVTSQHNNVKKMEVVQSPHVEVLVTEGSKDDFKPTDPGHSPGVGHSYTNKIGQAN